MQQLGVFWLLIITFIQFNICCSKVIDQCVIKHDKIHIIFDFLTLSKTEYILQHKNHQEQIRIMLCHPLNEPCNGQKGAGACLYRGNKEIILGYKPTFTDDDGKMVFNFTGEPCRNNIHYALIIVMICDYKAKNMQPEVHPYTKEQCEISMTWKTITACGTSPPVSMDNINCTTSDNKGNVYNLSSLIKYSDNYLVSVDNSSSIILNVCHPVVYKSGAVCPFNSGVCLRHFNVSKNLSYENLGDIMPPIWENEELTIIYKPGKMDTVEGFTKVSFICDPNAVNTSPHLTRIKGNNKYYLSWKTAAACSNKDGTCSAINPVTNLEYNLKPLMSKDYIVESPEGIQYKLRICVPLLSHSCQSSGPKADAGICSAHNQTIGGKANANFFWSDGLTGPYLNYTDGSPCGNHNRRFTIIHFNCSRDESKNVPVVLEDKACHLFIQWNTLLVCEEKSMKHSSLSDDVKPMISTPDTVQSNVPSSTIITKPNFLNSSNTTNTTIDKPSKITHVSIVTCGILFITFGIVVILYFSNTRIRACINTYCCSRCLRRPDIRMQYSKINTGPEMDSLLDAPDTICQSEDSDDDLLRL